MNRDETSEFILASIPSGPLIRLSLQRGSLPAGMEAVSANLIGYRRRGRKMVDIVYNRSAGRLRGRLEVNVVEGNPSLESELAATVAERWGNHVGWSVTAGNLFQLCTCLDAQHLSRRCRPSRLTASMLVVQHLAHIQGVLEHKFADEPSAAVIPVLRQIDHVLVTANKDLAKVTRMS